MFGIYKITNKLNNKCYIGKSSNITERWAYHKREYSYFTKNWNKTLYKAFRKYGIDNFTFEVIEEMNESEYQIFGNNREQYWIAFYNSFKEGYNETQGGDGGNIPRGLSKTKKLTDDEVKNIRELYDSCQICVSDAYKLYEDKISFRGFRAVWSGHNHKSIMPEVYTDKNKRKHILIERQRVGRLRQERKKQKNADIL